MRQPQKISELSERVWKTFRTYGNSLPVVVQLADMSERTFRTETFLHSLATANGKIVQDDFTILDKMARRIEVFRRLDRAYDDEIRKTIVREPVATEYVRFLCAAFCCAFQQQQDYRHLNTALKINGGILEAPKFSPPDDLSELANALVWSV